MHTECTPSPLLVASQPRIAARSLILQCGIDLPQAATCQVSAAYRCYNNTLRQAVSQHSLTSSAVESGRSISMVTSFGGFGLVPAYPPVEEPPGLGPNNAENEQLRLAERIRSACTLPWHTFQAGKIDHRAAEDRLSAINCLRKHLHIAVLLALRSRQKCLPVFSFACLQDTRRAIDIQYFLAQKFNLLLNLGGSAQ